jgi:stress response protein YsnF
VDGERRPVSSEFRESTLSGNPFQERTGEMENCDEQAVVSKEARVKEELVVRKNVEQHTEAVSDTVRRTEVDIEDERDNRSSGTATVIDHPNVRGPRYFH